MHINISNKELCIASLVTCTLSENKVSDIIDNVHVQISFTSLTFNFLCSNVIHGVHAKVSMNFLIVSTMFNVQVSIQMLFIVFMLKFQ